MATCSSADSVLEAASLIKSNSTKLNTFVNGAATETVQLGTGDPTPTLRNLVANALEHVAESMGDSVEAAVATINELESGKADKVSGNVEDHIAALDMYGNLQDSRIDMGDVATISVDIANLDTGKADKVSEATNGHIATLNASGNLTDSGLAKADVQTKLSSFTENNIRTTNASGFAKDSGKAIADVQFKLSSATANNVLKADANGFMADSGIAAANVQQKLTGHTANHLLSVASSGFMTDSGIAKADVQTKLTGHTAGNILVATSGGFMSDSGVKPEDKADKVEDAVEGNFAGLDASGNLTDSGRSPADIAALEEAVESLDERKADKFVPAEPGNLAKLNESGNLRDAGRSVEDLVPLLDYTSNEVLSHHTLSRMSLDRYRGWYSGEMDLVRDAGWLSEASQQRNRAFIDNFRQAQQLRKIQLEHAQSLDPVLFIIAGQSNGMGATREGPTERAPDVAEFWNYTLDTPAFQPMKDPTTTVNFGSAWPEFCRTFFDLTGRKTIILNVSYSGASATGGNYEAQWSDDGHGVARAYAQAQYEDMMAAIADSSKPYVWGGLIWVQGEGDGVKLNAGTITANDFKLATLDVLSWFRTLTGQANLPIFISQTGHRQTAYNGSNPSLLAAEKQIQAVQEEICADTSDNIYMAFTLAKTFYGCGMMNDTVHYNQKGYNLMGRSIAQCCANVLNF